ncbi:MAG TPA: DUF72 domain-containing protein [Steroidobacteraceae bacterium]|nr:DUF72 domain-containing protein [Candidatus Dormibacteraeota bacterium]HYM29292.1 DUF72 domain-containing protein [Steroidobacteraceae bacterium]
MRTWVGTSGYNYPEWKGSFYPEKMPAAKMLPFYAAAFSTVEINYTFYRVPNEKTLAGWSRETPDGFRLTLKAPKRITHIAKLHDCADLLQYFLKTAGTLGPKLGAILFQLPPYFRKDLTVLDEFLALLPAGCCAAFEFRHASWMDAEVFARLRARNLALCIADSEKFSTPLEITAGYGYFRLRDEGYTPEDLRRWAATIRTSAAACSDVFVYFKHEEAGKGPQFARLLLEALTPA